MKYIIATALIGLLSGAASAQNGFYLAPSAGIGYSHLQNFGNPNNSGVWANTGKSVFSYNIQAGIGYRYKNWRFQSGIQYSRIGWEMGNLGSGPGFDRNVASEFTMANRFRAAFNQVGIPLQVGYSIPVNKKFSLVPYAGIVTSFTFSGSSISEGNGNGRRSESSLPASALDEYGRIKAWILAGAQLEYKLNSKISLFGGPSFQYKFASSGVMMENTFTNLHINAGVSIGL